MTLVGWNAMGSYMRDLSGPRATNLVKFTHDWENDPTKGYILSREYQSVDKYNLTCISSLVRLLITYI